MGGICIFCLEEAQVLNPNYLTKMGLLSLLRWVFDDFDAVSHFVLCVTVSPIAQWPCSRSRARSAAADLTAAWEKYLGRFTCGDQGVLCELKDLPKTNKTFDRLPNV